MLSKPASSVLECVLYFQYSIHSILGFGCDFSQEFSDACVPGTKLSDLCVPRSTYDKSFSQVSVSLWEKISVRTASVCWAGQEGPEPRVCFGWWGLASLAGLGNVLTQPQRSSFCPQPGILMSVFPCRWLLGSSYFCFLILHGMTSDRIYRTTLWACTMLILFIFLKEFFFPPLKQIPTFTFNFTL